MTTFQKRESLPSLKTMHEGDGKNANVNGISPLLTVARMVLIMEGTALT